MIQEICAQLADLEVPALYDLEIRERLDSSLAAKLIAETDTARAQYLRGLLLECDPDTRAEHFEDETLLGDDGLPDPVLTAIQRTAEELHLLQDRLYRMVAYARELPPPRRRYTLKELATSAGMSPSGISTCYSDSTIAETVYVLEFGADRRNSAHDSRWKTARPAGAGRSADEEPPF